MSRRIRRVYIVVLLLMHVPWLSSCVTNPVTGETELGLVSEAQERELGRKNYGPYRQAQGGDYVADPELVRYVKQVGERIAVHADRKLPYEFNVVNDSSPNAWALPGGKIAINRGLLVELQNEAELAAVLAHEVVHAAARHSAQSMERNLLFQGALIAAGVALGDSDYAEVGRLGAQIGTAAGQQYYSREAEREADHYGMKYMVRAGYDPNAAVELQQTFVRLAENKNSSWIEGLFASHPPSPERVANNRKLFAELGKPGGELGEQRYRKAIARLVRTKPAYEAYDKARLAFKEKQFDKALALVDKAIKVESQEAAFHTLRGEIHAAKGNHKTALRSYDKAMGLNPGYYQVSLARGLLHRELNNTQAARKDLTRSRELLPTANGEYALGLLERDFGNMQDAVAHFRNAAKVDSAVGRAAADQLEKMQQPLRRSAVSGAMHLTGPVDWVQTGLSLNRDNKLVLSLRNTGAKTVEDIQVLLLELRGGRLRQLGHFRTDFRIAPGQTVRAATGIGPVSSARFRSLSVKVKQVREAN